MPARRELAFASIDEIMPEVDRLMDGGYTTVGNWTFAQICNHMTCSVIWSVEGFPVVMPWMMRATVGKVIKAVMFKTGKIRENIKIPNELLPKPDLDPRAEVEALRAAIRLYQADTSKRALHPILGKLTPAEMDRLHCIHSAHHLSFVLPN